MPATAGRVRMPANNRVHSSAALQTHGIWQSAIGYDPYAPDQKNQQEDRAGAPEKGAGPGAADQQNAYDSFQGLLALARLTGSNADVARGSCKKCGRVGHLSFQCRNILTAKEAEAAAVAAVLERERGSKGKDGEGLGDVSSLDSSSEESSLSDSDEDSEMERLIASKYKKRLGGDKDKVKLPSGGLLGLPTKKKRVKSRKKKRISSSDDSDQSSQSGEEDKRRLPDGRRQGGDKGVRKNKGRSHSGRHSSKRGREPEESDDSRDSGEVEERIRHRHQKKESSRTGHGSDSLSRKRDIKNNDGSSAEGSEDYDRGRRDKHAEVARSRKRSHGSERSVQQSPGAKRRDEPRRALDERRSRKSRAHREASDIEEDDEALAGPRRSRDGERDRAMGQHGDRQHNRRANRTVDYEQEPLPGSRHARVVEVEKTRRRVYHEVDRKSGTDSHAAFRDEGELSDDNAEKKRHRSHKPNQTSAKGTHHTSHRDKGKGRKVSRDSDVSD